MRSRDGQMLARSSPFLAFSCGPRCRPRLPRLSSAMLSASLLTAVRRFADAHADPSGIAATGIPGVTVLRAAHPGELQYAISRPLVALVVQGGKRVMTGRHAFDFGAGDALVIAADVPTISQVTQADVRTPYYSLVFDLVPALIETLALEMGGPEHDPGAAIRVERTEAEVEDAALRLMQLLDRPQALPILHGQRLRELHYWLLAGRHGAAIRSIGSGAGRAQRIGRAVAVIRADYARPLRAEQLAEVAGMSTSTFHKHFRAVTSLSPLQFQKQLRLIEARRMMLSEGGSASRAAHAVGYESVPQFTREYARLFGQPPVREIRDAKTRLLATA
ncbi:MAG: AraC family transcriptional regulator N-terminal domain-containing protein [Vitreoscilla sp.]